MAHIVNTLQRHFTGHVGPVRFVRGHADCDDPELLEFFRADPDRYAVDDDAPGGQKPDPGQDDLDKDKGEDDPDEE